MAVKKFTTIICTLICAALVMSFCVMPAYAAEVPTSNIEASKEEASIGTPIYTCAAEDASKVMLGDMDAIAATRGYTSVEAPENAFRKFTRNDEGIIRTVVVGDGYVMVSSLDTMHGYPVGACYLVPMLACTGEDIFDPNAGLDLFI